jgi:transposase
LLAKDEVAAPAARLLTLKGIGPEFASVLWLEGLFRGFRNRRQVAAYAGLAPSPWQSGTMNGEQGISQSGNPGVSMQWKSPGLRTAMVELAWLWLRHQPDSALSRWFQERVARGAAVSVASPSRRWIMPRDRTGSDHGSQHRANDMAR